MKAKLKSKQNKELKAFFRQDSTRLPIDQDRKKQSLLQLDQVIHEKKIVPLASRKEILKAQLQFMDYQLIALQGASLLILLLVYWNIRRTMHDTADTSLLCAPLLTSAPIFSMFMITACRREEVYGIAELAGSCYFNHRQTCALRMVLYGMLNLLIMTGISLFLRNAVQRSAVEICIYFLVPFLVTGCVQLTVLITGFGRRNHYNMIAVGLIMTILWTRAASFPAIYEPSARMIWTGALLCSAICYGTEIVIFLKRMERGGLLCAN